MTQKKISKYIFFTIMVLIVISCDDILEVPDISNANVTLIAPAEGAQIESNTTVFTWQGVADAESYELQVASPDFANAAQVVVDSITNSTSFSTTLLPNSYEWRVRALNSGFATAFSSNNFIVNESDGFSGNTLILESPVNDFATSETDIDLSWQPLTDAIEYRIQILDSTDDIVLDEVISETELGVTFTEGSFRWQVRGQTATENTLFSNRTIIIDMTPPNVPQLTAPGINETFNTNDIDFSWDREAVSGSQERDSIFIYDDMALQNLVSSGASTSRTFTATLQSGIYFWQVQAFDAAGNESTVSGTGTFIIN